MGRARFLLLIGGLSALFFVSVNAQVRWKIDDGPVDKDHPIHGTPGSRPEPPQLMAATSIANYDFETNDPQGWTSHDLTGGPLHFHVADNTSLNGGNGGQLTPIQGNQSLWCGVSPSGSDPYCSYFCLPGYGNNWRQCWESVNFPVTGNVSLAYIIKWDTEPAYDVTRVEYEDLNGQWVELAHYDGTGVQSENFTIPSSQLNGDIRIRFYFTSDGAWSNQDFLCTDGAAIFDSVAVSDGNGPVDYQSFETEPPGALTTNDGHWSACEAAFGDYACLQDGKTLLQEVNFFRRDRSTVWAFICGSPDTYCRDAAQTSTPFGPNADGLFLDNEIWSPWIDWNPSAGQTTHLHFKVYRDLPLDNLVFYKWHVRERTGGGCAGPWKDRNFVYYGKPKWYKPALPDIDITDLISSSADQIQIALGVIDLAGVWGGVFGSGACHSHAPLFDNVEVLLDNTHSWVVNDFDLFQDNFATDGTLTGTVRVDAATGADYATVRVYEQGVGIDYLTSGVPSSGPAVFCHVKNLPGKSGSVVSGGAQWPYVASMSSADWTVLQCDSGATDNEFTVDLNDGLYTPGDTIYFYFSARDANNVTSYWSQFTNVTTSEADVRAYPMEMTCLPANALSAGGAAVLYVDGFSSHGAEPYFDTAFEELGLTVDRYDVRGPSSTVGNGLGSRVVNPAAQVLGQYQAIMWNTGDLEYGALGSSDYALLWTFLDDNPIEGAGVYLSGDAVASQLAASTNPNAVNLRSTYIDYNVVGSIHTEVGEPVSPEVIGASGSAFDPGPGPDTLIAYGGDSEDKRFDVLQAQGAASVQMAYSNNSSHAAVVAQSTLNSLSKNVNVVLSGFSYDDIRDDTVQFPADRVQHMQHVGSLLGILSSPVAAPGLTHYTNALGQNVPNPFNPVTAITYSIRSKAHVSLRVYDVAGRLVRTLVDAEQSPRESGFSVRWDGTSNTGEHVASGVYFYKLVAGNYSETKKMVLLK